MKIIWAERKIQEEMNSWAREKRKESVEVKVEYRKVRVTGRWKEWEDEKGEGVSYLEREVRDGVRERRLCEEGMAFRKKERDNEGRSKEDFA